MRFPFVLLIFAASGLLVSFAFPKENLFPLAWVGLSPAFALLPSLSAGRAAWCGLAWGTAFFGKLLFWLNLFGFAAYVLVVLMQSAFYALAFAVANWAGRRVGRPFLVALCQACSWAAIAEWLRAQGKFGFAWGELAQAHYSAPFLLQICFVAGPFGFALLCALANAYLALSIRRWILGERYLSSKVAVEGAARWGLTVLVTLVAGFFGPLYSGSAFKVVVVQGRTEQRLESRRFAYASPALDDYERLSLEAGRGTKLIVWPETALPGPSSVPNFRPW